MNKKVELNISVLLSFEPQRLKTYLRTCVPNEDSDQPAHSRSLIRIFTVRILDSQGCKGWSCGQLRLGLDAQADLSLRSAHMSIVTFADISVHFMVPLTVLPFSSPWERVYFVYISSCRYHVSGPCRSLAFLHLHGMKFWAATSENVPSDMCAQRRLKSIFASAQSSLPAWRIFAFLAIQNAPSQDSDKIARMRRLI